MSHEIIRQTTDEALMELPSILKVLWLYQSMLPVTLDTLEKQSWEVVSVLRGANIPDRIHSFKNGDLQEGMKDSFNLYDLRSSDPTVASRIQALIWLNHDIWKKVLETLDVNASITDTHLFTSLWVITTLNNNTWELIHSEVDTQDSLIWSSEKSKVSLEYGDDLLKHMAFEKAYFHVLCQLFPWKAPELTTHLLQEVITRIVWKQYYRWWYTHENITMWASGTAANEELVELVAQKYGYSEMTLEQIAAKEGFKDVDVLASIFDELCVILLSHNPIKWEKCIEDWVVDFRSRVEEGKILNFF